MTLVWVGMFLSVGGGWCQEGTSAEPNREIATLSSQSEVGSSSAVVEGMRTELYRIEEDIPKEMVLLTETLVGPVGVVEYDPDRRIVVLSGPSEGVSHALVFLDRLRETYEDSTRSELIDRGATADPWSKAARYFGKLQPGESVQIEALLLIGRESANPESAAERSSSNPSRKEVLEDLLLELDEKKKVLTKAKGAESPELLDLKQRMGVILDFLDEERGPSESEIKELVSKLEQIRDRQSERLQHIDPNSNESVLIRQEIIRYNQLLERAVSERSELLVGEMMHALKGTPSNLADGVPATQGLNPIPSLHLPPEAERIGLKAEDLSVFAFSEIETLGQSALRATVFGNDSNGIAFTTVSEYSLEFRLGHSTLGVTVALIPERKVRDQTKGIQGLVTRLNKILLDTETEVELNEPIVVGSYTHPDGDNLVLVVRLQK